MFSRGLNMVINWADKKTKFEDHEEGIWINSFKFYIYL
jgi:hypothetical protein